MNWFLLACFAIVFRATQSIGTKVLTNKVKVSAPTQAILFTILPLVFAIPLMPFIGGLSFSALAKVWPTATLTVFSLAFANTVFFKGQDKLDASYTQIAFSSTLVWGTTLSVVFLGSHFSHLQLIGIAILLLAIIGVQYNHGSKSKLNAGVVYILLSAFFASMFQISSAKLAPKLSTTTYLFLTYLGASVVISAIYYKKLHEDFKILRNQSVCVFKYASLAAAMSLLYFIFSFYAYKHAPDRGVVVVLLTTQVIFTVILATIFLKERVNIGRKIAASILAIIAAALIK